MNGRTFVSETVEGWQLVAGTEVRIAFKNGELSAGAGCNSIGGQYSIDGTTLALPGYSMTDVGCEPARLAQDDWLLKFLRASPSLELVEPRLVMTTSNAKMTMLDLEVASPDRPLVGTQWSGQGFSDGSVTSFGLGSAEVSAFFDPSGSVTIFTSCQTGTGTYQVGGATISFSSLSYDGAPCTNGYQTTSDQVMLVLDGSPVSFSIQERNLTLTHGQSSLLFRSAN